MPGLAAPAIIRSAQNWRTERLEAALWNLAFNAASQDAQAYAAYALWCRWNGKPSPMVIDAPADPLSLLSDDELRAELARLEAQDR